jgi:hypothetical protein
MIPQELFSVGAKFRYKEKPEADGLPERLTSLGFFAFS